MRAARKRRTEARLDMTTEGWIDAVHPRWDNRVPIGMGASSSRQRQTTAGALWVIHCGTGANRGHPTYGPQVIPLCAEPGPDSQLSRLGVHHRGCYSSRDRKSNKRVDWTGLY